MDIVTKSTKIHTAVATTDVLKAVAIAAVKNQLGLADAAVLSADATVGIDGAITVEVVEAVADAAPVAPVDAPAAPEVAPTAPAVAVIPIGLGGLAA